VAFDLYDVVEDAQGDVINWRGHIFYLLTFPTEGITWAYDLQGNYWFEWRTWIANQNDFAAWRPRWHAMAFGEHRMLDAETGSLYALSAEVFMDVDDRPMRWLRVAPELSAMNELIPFSLFALAIEPGVGTVSGQGADPVVMMRYSDDSGRTWSAEQQRRIGALGEYWQKVEWWRLGSAEHRVFEVSGSDPVPMRIVDAFLGLGQPIKALQGAGKAA
jgi:hypothetical protein